MLITRGRIETAFGPFAADVFAAGGTEVIVLHTDNIPGVCDGILCRIQSECIAHTFFDEACDCAEQISTALRSIRQAGAGLLIYLRQDGMGLGMSGKLLGQLDDWRGYDAAVAILQFYGIRSVELLSLNVRKIAAIENANIVVNKAVRRNGIITVLGKRIARMVEQVRRGESVHPIGGGARHSRVFLCSAISTLTIATQKCSHAWREQDTTLHLP